MTLSESAADELIVSLYSCRAVQKTKINESLYHNEKGNSTRSAFPDRRPVGTALTRGHAEDDEGVEFIWKQQKTAKLESK